MIDSIDRTGKVFAPTREDISSWVAEVVWGMDGRTLMRNAWRKTGYDWFEGDARDGEEVAAEDAAGDVKIDNESDSDDYLNAADMVEDVLGWGEVNDDESDDDNIMWGTE